MSKKGLRRAKRYKWKCDACKVCLSCGGEKNKGQSLLVCRKCDKPYHPACLGLDSMPDFKWHCSDCTRQHDE